MMDVAHASKILAADQPRMLDRPPDPDTCVEPRLLYHGSGESNATLENYPRLLRVDCNRTSLASGGNPPVERLSYCRWCSGEVLSQSIAAARVPQVLGDEAVPTLGTAPEWFLRTGHGSSRLIPDFFGRRICWLPNDTKDSLCQNCNCEMYA
jgi:hypothetical protein